jgi:hypothetical protein
MDCIGTPPTKLMNPPPAFQEEVVQYILNTSICSKCQSIPFLHLSPYIFCEIFCNKINRYARDYLQSKQRRQICGYIWKSVTINELLTYLEILVFSMLYPQTCRRVRTAWKNQQINSWTSHMGIGWLCQINSMLHFNNNDDDKGIAKDSLHKIRPLLQIIKKR